MSDKQQQWVDEVEDALVESINRDKRIIVAITLIGKKVFEEFERQDERISTLESLVEMLLESHDKYQHGDN